MARKEDLRRSRKAKKTSEVRLLGVNKPDGTGKQLYLNPSDTARCVGGIWVVSHDQGTLQDAYERQWRFGG